MPTSTTQDETKIQKLKSGQNRIMGRPESIPFVGEERQGEVEALLKAFRRVKETNRPELFMLIGLPGWGKTRIIQEFYRRLAAEHQQAPRYWPPTLIHAEATSRGLDFASLSEERRRVRHTASFIAPPGSRIPWLWLAPSIRAALGAGSALVVDDLYAELRAHMGPLLDRAKAVHESLGSLAQLAAALLPLPDVLSLVSEGSSAVQSLKTLIQSQQQVQTSTARTIDRTASTEQRAEEVGRLLRQITRGSPGLRPLPIVLVLDDSHGLDRLATELITGLIGSELPVLVVATTWPDRFESDLPFCEFVRTSSAEGVSVRRLAPLSGSDLGNLVLAVAPRTSPDVTRALAARAGENPYALMLLLASEGIRLATFDDAIHLDPAEVEALGSSIEKLLDEHWENLSLESRVILSVAALIGETVVRGPLASVITQVIPEVILEEHADPLWIRTLAQSAQLLGFLERVRYELALSKTARLFPGHRRSVILQQAADAISGAVRDAVGIERRVLLAGQYELSASGARVDPWELAKGALELAELARGESRSDEVIKLLTPIIDGLSPESAEEARVLIQCLNRVVYSSQLSNASRESSQSFAARALEVANRWLPNDDDLSLLAIANKARSLRRESAPEQLNEAEQLAQSLRHKIDNLPMCSLEVQSNVRRLEVLIQISRGNFALSSNLAEQNFEFCKQHFGPIAKETTSAMAGLGHSLQRISSPRAIEIRSDRLRRMSERLGDQNHVAIAGAKRDLAISLLELGKPTDTDQAIQLIKQAVQVLAAVFGLLNSVTLEARSSMIRARCHQALAAELIGDIESANRIIESLEEESVSVYDLRSQSTVIGQVAMANQRRGETLALRHSPDAIGYLQHSLELRMTRLHQGLHHYSVRKCAQSLHWALNRLGQKQGADAIVTQFSLTAAEQALPGF